VTSTVWLTLDLAVAVVSFLLTATYASWARRIDAGQGEASPVESTEARSTVDPDDNRVSDLGWMLVIDGGAPGFGD
jgi:hypothetical protein